MNSLKHTYVIDRIDLNKTHERNASTTLKLLSIEL